MGYGKWEVKIKKVLIFFVVALFAFRLWQTTGCKHFSGFYFNHISIKINVEEQRNLDKNSNQLVSKIFHNKVSSTIDQISLSYARTFNPRFILEILGPLGLILALMSFSKTIKNPKSVYGLCVAIVALASLLLILPIDPAKSFYLTAIAWFCLSILSTADFAKSKLMILTFFVLLLASFWYFALSWQMPLICNEIFFN